MCYNQHKDQCVTINIKIDADMAITWLNYFTTTLQTSQGVYTYMWSTNGYIMADTVHMM